METNLVIEGIKFMFLGMGTVFAFLIIMIMVMNVMSAVIHKFFPEPQASADVGDAPKQDNKNIVAAITAAVKYHRKG